MVTSLFSLLLLFPCKQENSGSSYLICTTSLLLAGIPARKHDHLLLVSPRKLRKDDIKYRAGWEILLIFTFHLAAVTNGFIVLASMRDIRLPIDTLSGACLKKERERKKELLG